MDRLRTIQLAPYGKGRDKTRFALTTWDAGTRDGRNYLRYRLTMREPGKFRRFVFEGDGFGCSPLHSIDGDDSLAALLSFLTLRPGDTDADYFASYNAEQIAFCHHHAEALSLEALCRFGER